MIVLCSICYNKIYQMPKCSNVCFFCYSENIVSRLKRRRSSADLISLNSFIELLNNKNNQKNQKVP